MVSVEAKEAVGLLSDEDRYAARPEDADNDIWTHHELTIVEAEEIAALIEQQEQELNTLHEQRKVEVQIRLLAAKMKSGEIKIPPDVLVFKDNGEDLERELREELEKEQYAELGRLAVWGADECGCDMCKDCCFDEFCRKYAELKGVVQE